jgi:hypothetical protein
VVDNPEDDNQHAHALDDGELHAELHGGDISQPDSLPHTHTVGSDSADTSIFRANYIADYGPSIIHVHDDEEGSLHTGLQNSVENVEDFSEHFHLHESGSFQYFPDFDGDYYGDLTDIGHLHYDSDADAAKIDSKHAMLHAQGWLDHYGPNHDELAHSPTPPPTPCADMNNAELLTVAVDMNIEIDSADAPYITCLAAKWSNPNFCVDAAAAVANGDTERHPCPVTCGSGCGSSD